MENHARSFSLFYCPYWICTGVKEQGDIYSSSSVNEMQTPFYFLLFTFILGVGWYEGFHNRSTCVLWSMYAAYPTPRAMAAKFL